MNQTTEQKTLYFFLLLFVFRRLEFDVDLGRGNGDLLGCGVMVAAGLVVVVTAEDFDL